ncbi:2OG-Fe(II) oxygenase [bacterium]|nr:2OG-Fe(II) oxygenase [bacterium]
MWFLKESIDHTETYAFIPQVFDKQQCDKIVQLGESLIPSIASTFGGIQTNVRDSKVSWIVPSEHTEWIFRILTDAINNLNSQFFKFDLDGFSQGIQFTKYEAPAGKYDLHIDKSYGSGIRKLSIVVQLSDPINYQGGELCIQTSNQPLPMEKKQGFLVAFPSYVLHGVRPVTQGTRYSLVAWITGPSFK